MPTQHTIFQYLFNVLGKVYHRPLLSAVCLAAISNLYLIADFGVVNRSAIPMLWQLQQMHESSGVSMSILAQCIAFVQQFFSLSAVDAAHALMIIAYTGITVLLLLIARLVHFSLPSQWALLFLLLAHPSYNDFRSYIILEPLFWLLWLLAIYGLMRLYKSHTVWAIFLWLGIFFVTTWMDVAAWFWLLLFPLGALFWRPWRRKSVVYALLGYTAVISVLLFLPLYQGTSSFEWLKSIITNSPQELLNILSVNNNNWVREDDKLMAGIFIFSGATSLVIIRTLISFGVGAVILSVYGIQQRQYKIVQPDHLRMLIYIIGFDCFISIILFILAEDSNSILSFSISLLLLLFAALGLSYVFKKIQSQRYSQLSVLVIIWCMVAYFASGFIIFGPRQDYLRTAGEAFSQAYPDTPVASNSQYFLYYAGKNPQQTLSSASAQFYSKPLYYGYLKGRNTDLPPFWQQQSALLQFANRRGDTLLIYGLNGVDKSSLKP